MSASFMYSYLQDLKRRDSREGCADGGWKGAQVAFLGRVSDGYFLYSAVNINMLSGRA